MAQRCPDLFAWVRAVLGPHELPATTRLVLCAHVPFMDRDGGNCWVGVRRLAQGTNLNKSTVARHRASAVEAGWLITSEHSSRSRNRIMLAAVPDALCAAISERSSSKSASRVYGRVGQSKEDSRRSLSGINIGSVHSRSPDCTVSPDIPSSPSIPSAGSIGSGSIRANTGAGRPQRTAAAEANLARWIANSDQANDYLHDLNALYRLTPFHGRFQGYEDVIRQASGLRKSSVGRDTNGRGDREG